MIVLWLVAGVSLLVAVLSWNLARRLARRFEELSERYWALAYEVGELRVQLQRLSGEATGPPSAPPSQGAPRLSSSQAQAFVPLENLKR
jgi:hypothetical protein